MSGPAKPLWTPEIAVDAERARAMIAARFPELRATRVERLGQGWDNAAYLVDDHIVFRFPQRAVSAPLVATEIAVLPTLAPLLPLAIPVPRWIGGPDDTYPWRFAGYSLLPGTPLDVVRPADDEREPLARALAGFLRALHAVDPAPYLAAGLQADVVQRMNAALRLPQGLRVLERLAGGGAIGADDAGRLARALRVDAPDGEPSRQAVVHGDLYARHLLLDDAGALTAVIDWGDVHHGEIAIDLATAHEVLPHALHAAFLAAYGPVDDRTWRRARFVAVRHAIIVADYGLEIGDAALAQGGLDALARVLAALRAADQ